MTSTGRKRCSRPSSRAIRPDVPRRLSVRAHVARLTDHSDVDPITIPLRLRSRGNHASPAQPTVRAAGGEPPFTPIRPGRAPNVGRRVAMPDMTRSASCPGENWTQRGPCPVGTRVRTHLSQNGSRTRISYPVTMRPQPCRPVCKPRARVVAPNGRKGACTRALDSTAALIGPKEGKAVEPHAPRRARRPR